MLFRSFALTAVTAAFLPFSGAYAQAPAPAPAVPGTPAAPPLNAAAPMQQPAAGQLSKEDVKNIVKDYLISNPDVIVQAMEKYREKKEAEEKAKTAQALESRKADLLNDPASPAVGSDKPDVTVVEFFDYHCGYCKHMLPTVSKILKDDPKVRFVFKEFPILSEDSTTAAKAALAVNSINKAKYFEFHTELMNGKAKFDEKSLADAAKKVGIPADKLKAEMAKPEIEAQLKKNREIAEQIGMRGTPAFVIGGEFIPGAISEEDLRKLIAAERQKSSATSASGVTPPSAPVVQPPASAPTPVPSPAPVVEPKP